MRMEQTSRRNGVKLTESAAASPVEIHAGA
jgi:hypothetical protein